MQIKVLASNSTANCYILEDENSSLILEAGIHISELKKALNYDFSRVVGALISHEHSDHSRAVKDLCKLGIECHMSPGTCSALKINNHRISTTYPLVQFTIAEFVIKPFGVNHDSLEPFGFIIKSRISKKKVVFATDTSCIMYRFPEVNIYMIECNYDIETLRNNVINGSIDRQTAKRITETHFELSNVKTFLGSSDLSKLDKVVLLHLSDNNSDASIFLTEIEQVTGPGKVCIAEPGLIIEI